MKRCWLWWSSGKDSAWALHTLHQDPDCRVEALVTTVNQRFERVAIHAVREALLERQAQAVGLPLRRVPIPHPCPNGAYEAAARRELEAARERGVDQMAFGDLFLEDVRDYRLGLLEGSGAEPRFPIWGLDTMELARAMLEAGLKAFVTCIDPRVLPRSFAGRAFDADFLADLPAGVDPCGEQGEFHTFAWDGPMFREPVPVAPGEVVEREGFVFADLQPAPG